MNTKQFPVIDPIATGKNIIRLRVERGMSVRDLQAYFGFEEPAAGDLQMAARKEPAFR